MRKERRIKPALEFVKHAMRVLSNRSQRDECDTWQKSLGHPGEIINQPSRQSFFAHRPILQFGTQRCIGLRIDFDLAVFTIQRNGITVSPALKGSSVLPQLITYPLSDLADTRLPGIYGYQA